MGINMKKNITRILFIILIIGLIATLLACANSNNKSQNNTKDEISVVQIDIDNSSVPSTVYVGEFNASSISFDVLYSDGSKQTLSLKEEYMVTQISTVNNKFLPTLTFVA